MSADTGMFYNWQQWEKTGNPANHIRGDNPPFSTNHYSMQPGGRKLLKGYMRSSLPEKFGHARFHFQYNPNLISRSTAINQDLLGLANQTAADIQAMSMAGAGAGFSFSLILDRQDEVASAKFSNEAFALNLETPEDPRTGVDVDIRVLDKIAGIGQFSVAAESVATSTGITDILAGGAARLIDRIEAAQVAGDGNQAFMASGQPIRAVFSKNFVVEGFLSNIDVNYTKFSRNMVPVVATVQCAMQAFYIGAARQTTWWSDQVASGAFATAIAARLRVGPGNVDATTTLGASSDPTNVDAAVAEAARRERANNPQPYGNTPTVTPLPTGRRVVNAI